MFNNDFKTRALQLCLLTGSGAKAVRLMEEESYTGLRYLFEELLDDPNLYEGAYLGNSKRVKKTKIHIHRKRQEMYSELVDIINTRIDSGRIPKKLRVCI